MTAEEPESAFGDWWPPTFGDTNAERYKWAWNALERELVWRVSGPGDGRPFHEEQVGQAWGREPSPAHGDVLGIASYVPGHPGERAHLSIYGYYGSTVPAAIVGWFSDAFPGAEIAPPRSSDE